jgi:16S rRNA (guanine527-N7)-methyltransferase
MTGHGMNIAQLAAALSAGVKALDQTLPEGATEKLAQLLAQLERWNARVNLTSIAGSAAMVSVHVLDSLAVRPWLTGKRIIDVGTGAGFPGLPLAIAEPGLSLELLDGSGRKIAFVKHMIGELQITNAVAMQARAEHYAPDTLFDTVVARAFAAIPELVRFAGHLVGENGVLLAMKGKYPQDELRQLEDMKELSVLWNYNVTQLAVPGIESHARHLAVLRRRKSAE